MRDRLLTVLILCGVLAGSVVPVIVGAQVTPTPGPIDYGPTITTDHDKLYACESLIRQLVDEYNRQSIIASAEPERYADKFRAYTLRKWQGVMQTLLAERSTIMENIRRYYYSGEEWIAISAEPDSWGDVWLDLYGNLTAEKEKPTLAVCDGLNEVKAIDLADVDPLSILDPVEDFLSYTEVDPGSDLTIDTNTIDWSTVDSRDSDTYVYDDKGANHFDGDYEHTYLLRVTSFSGDNNGTYGFLGAWALANLVDDVYGIRQSESSHEVTYFYKAGLSDYDLYLMEWDTDTAYYDYWATPVLDTTYYMTQKRDEAVGTYGTIYLYICEDNYYGESGSDLKDTLSVALHTAKRDYRYVYASQTLNTGTANRLVTGWVEDLDLHEGAGPTAVPFSFGYIMGA